MGRTGMELNDRLIQMEGSVNRDNVTFTINCERSLYARTRDCQQVYSAPVTANPHVTYHSTGVGREDRADFHVVDVKAKTPCFS